MRTVAVIVAVTMALTGCGALPEREREPQVLFEQIPAWDNAAEKICCGHLRECKPWQSPRC